MTLDEIIDMARKSKLSYGSDTYVLSAVITFAYLVAEHEREACAKLVEESSLPDTYSQECLPDIANEIRARGEA